MRFSIEIVQRVHKQIRSNQSEKYRWHNFQGCVYDNGRLIRVVYGSTEHKARQRADAYVQRRMIGMSHRDAWLDTASKEEITIFNERVQRKAVILDLV